MYNLITRISVILFYLFIYFFISYFKCIFPSHLFNLCKCTDLVCLCRMSIRMIFWNWILELQYNLCDDQWICQYWIPVLEDPAYSFFLHFLCFWAVLLKKTLESPLDYKIKTVNHKGNQSWIFIGRTDAEAEAPILWPPQAKTWSLEKTLMLRKIEHRRRRRRKQRIRWFDGITNSMDMNWSKLREMVKDREAWRTAVHGVAMSLTRQRDWTTTT